MPEFVKTTARILQGGTIASNTGQTLLLGRHNAPTDFTSAETLRRIVGFETHTSDASIEDSNFDDPAAVYFQQNPYPQNLVTGYRLNGAVNHIAIGTSPASVSDIASLGSAGQAGLIVNGAVATAALDFTSVDSYDGTDGDASEASHVLQTGINALTTHSGVVVYYDSDDGLFIVVSPNSFGAGFSGSVAEAFGLNDATIYPAIPANEGYDDALQRIDNGGAEFDFVVPGTAIVQDAQAFTALREMANWVSGATRNKMMIYDSYGTDVLVSNETTSVDARLSALKQDNVAAIYNGAVIDHKAIGYTAIFSAVDYEGDNTVISGAHQQIQGTTPTSLDIDATNELERKRINYYHIKKGRSYTREGWSYGTWIDAAAFANWFVNKANGDMQDALIQGNVRQRDTSNEVLNALLGVCELAVDNGMLAPGFASPEMLSDIRKTTKNPNFSSHLPGGYHVWKEPYSNLTDSQRAARQSVSYEAWGVGAGFVNDVEFNFNFQP